MKLQLLNLFTHTLDALLMYLFLAKILYKKDILCRKTIYLVGLIILNFSISIVLGSAEFLPFLIITVFSTLVYSYLLNTSISKTFAYTILGTIILGIIEITTVNIIILFFNIQPSIISELNFYRVLAIIISKSLFYLVIKYLVKKFKIPAYSQIKNFKIIILILLYNMFVIFMLVSLYGNIKSSSIRDTMYIFVIGIGIALLSFIIYKTIIKSMYQNQQAIVWKLKEEEFYKKNFYIKSMEDILETIKSQRHDLNNYFSTLYGLIYMKKLDDAKKYIDKISGEINNFNVIIDTNHPIITALISIKKNKAFENNIDMNLDIEISKDMDFEFVDLSIVIGNLLDNAIEACQLILKDRERRIDFKIYVMEEILRIEVKNTKIKSIKIDNENITKRFTTKADNEFHGYGLGNVEFIVKQYNGNMEISDLGDEFMVNIDLPMNRHKHSIA